MEHNQGLSNDRKINNRKEPKTSQPGTRNTMHNRISTRVLGLDSRIPFENKIIEGTSDLTQIPLTLFQQKYVAEIKNKNKHYNKR